MAKSVASKCEQQGSARAGALGLAATAMGQPAAAAATDPWQRALAGLQYNCQQFGANLAHLQHRFTSSLAQAPTARRPRSRAPSLPVASLSQAAVGAAGPAAAATWDGSVGSTTFSGGNTSASSGAVSREEVGRATWTFLHTLAAQYPERPTRQQQRDARNLIDILTRMYPCGECATHFKQLVKQSPPAVASRHDFAMWMCEAHNVVNRRLGKPTFNCALVEARWAGMECGDDGGADACSLDWGRRR